MKNRSRVTALRPASASKSAVARSAKWQGEIAEMAFQHKATKMGFTVTKPYGENESYDFIVDAGNRLWRVQVKSTSRKWSNAYPVSAIHFGWGQKTRWAYTPEQIDILAAYIVPADAWYIVPVQAFVPALTLRFYPQIPGSNRRYERFREAWFLMACHRNGEPREGIVTSPPCSYSPSARSSCPACPFTKK
jgi:hypothetical protein